MLKFMRKSFTSTLLASLLVSSMGNFQALNVKAQEIDTSDHEVVTMLALGDRPTNGRLENMLEELNKILLEKVNAELEIVYVEWADWQTQYNIQLLAGDPNLDLITTATDWLYAWENTQKGAFLPLTDEMLQTYAPLTWEQVEANDSWDVTRYQGEISFIPEDNYTQYTNHGMFYRGDWAAEAGLENGEVTKFDDLTTYFSYIKENHPDVIPWDVAGVPGALPGYITSNELARVLVGLNAGNYEFWFTSADDPYTVYSPFMESDVIYEAAELMKEWNDLGVWREDVLNYTGDTRENMYAGLSGADQHHAQTYYSQIKPNMDRRQEDSDAKFYYWGLENDNVAKPIKTHGAMAVNAYSSNPERALMVYDIIRNDEAAYRLLNYGIEGVDYIVTEEGKLGRPEGWDPSLDGLGSNFWAGRMDELELENEENWDGTADFIAYLDSFAYDYEYENLIVDKTYIEAQQAAIANVLSEYMPQLSAGKFENPREAVDEMREKIMSAGYEEVKAAIQADMDKWVEER